MSDRIDPARGQPPYRPTGRGGSSGPSSRDIKRIVGIALMGVGAIFAVYGAGSGLSTLVRVSLDNFGLVCIAATLNFLFWTVMFFPIGGIIANTVCTVGGIMLFGGLPAIPGGLVAAGGLFVYSTA